MNWMAITNEYKTHSESNYPVVPGLLSPWVRCVNELEKTNSYINIFLIHLKEEPETETLKKSAGSAGWYKLPPSLRYSMYNRSTFDPEKHLTYNEVIYNAITETMVISYVVADNILTGYQVGDLLKIPILRASPPNPAYLSTKA